MMTVPSVSSSITPGLNVGGLVRGSQVWPAAKVVEIMRPNRKAPRILNILIGSLLWCVRSASPCPKAQKIYADETDFSGDPATYGDGSRFRNYSGGLLLLGCMQKFSKAARTITLSHSAKIGVVFAPS